MQTVSDNIPTSNVPARRKLAALFARHATLLGNAGALTAGTLVTAGLGFFYWWYAASHFSLQAVGYAAAAISLMHLLAQIGELGLGTLLIGEVQKLADRAPAVIAAALLGALLAGGLLAGGYLTFANMFSVHLGSITSSPARLALFVSGVGITAFILVLDQSFVGLLRSTLSLYRNMAFATIKLALIIWSASLASVDETVIFGTWVAGQLASLAVLAVLLASRARPVFARPRLLILRPMLGQVMRHHTLNIVIQAPSLMLPLIVTVMLSAEINAAFFAAWTLVGIILLVPASLASVLYSLGTREPELQAMRLKFSLTGSAILALLSGVGLYGLSHFILGLFNAAYPEIAGPSLQLLGFASFGVMFKYHYVMIQRLRYRMMQASALLAVCGALEVAAAAIGAHFGGLFGLTQGWIAAVAIEAAMISPVILSAIVVETKAHSRADQHDDRQLSAALPDGGAR